MAIIEIKKTAFEYSQKRFCLNIFLNDTCKNAMDLDDFVDSIEVGIEDIKTTSK
jgi:hypothetical protein